MTPQRSFLGSLAIVSLLFAATPVLASYVVSPLPSSLVISKPSACRLKATITSTIIVPYSEEASTVLVTTKPPQKTESPGGSAPMKDYDWPAWNPSGSDLSPGMTPEEQSGDCSLGTPDAPKYSGPLPGDESDSPWGSNPPWSGNPPPPSNGGSYPGNGAHGNGISDCVLIDPSKPPTRGQTRKYTFNIGYRQIAPDGVSKEGLVINGGFPGPTIEANWGDWIEVTVKNNFDQGGGTPEGLTIHWHGMLQKETPFMDGVPSVTQCPIVPGSSFTYRFRADQYGSSWYHSHYSAQYSGGVYGAMIIHGPNDSPKCAGYDEDLGPVLVGDWYHKSYFQLVNQTMSPKGGPPQSQSNLVNGRANYPCQNTTKACTPNAGLSKFKFESGKKYRMRLINPSSEALQKISIDGHKFKVIAQDFVPLVPYETDLITLSVGQRTDVIVEATGDSKSSFWFRSTLQANGKSCSLVDGINSNATAVIYYEDASPNAIPKSTSTITADRILNCENDPAANSVPLFPLTSEPVGELFTQTFNIDLFNNGTHNLWAINNITARVDYEVSQLYEASQGTLKPQPQWNLYTLPQSAGTARLILYNSFPFAGHPMHLHGHNFQVLAQGHGVWDGIITSPENPSRRDVIELPAALPNNAGRGYTVIQFVLDNPAIQIFHCHLAWHVSAGLYSALVEKPEDIRKFKVPDSIPDGCRKWADFGKTTVVDQIDSGV